MLRKDLERISRSNSMDAGNAMPVEIIGIDLSDEPTVTVRPLVNTQVFGLNGEVSNETPLEIREIPYSFPSSEDFAMFVPPKVGQQGLLVSSDTEIGEVEGGEDAARRVNDRRSGVFVPTGKIGGGNSFSGNPEWAELRSKGARIALSENAVHLQSGDTSLILDETGFNLVVGGTNINEALKQMSDHIAILEALLGLPRTPRDVDDLALVEAPTRSENGVR